jgi:hypothetical protein
MHNDVTAVKAPGTRNDISRRIIKNFCRVLGFPKVRLYPLESIKYKSKSTQAVGYLSFKNMQCASVIKKKLYCHQINK